MIHGYCGLHYYLPSISKDMIHRYKNIGIVRVWFYIEDMLCCCCLKSLKHLYIMEGILFSEQCFS